MVLSCAGSSVVGVCFLGRVVRLRLDGGFASGVAGLETIVFQLIFFGGVHSLRSSVTILSNIFCLRFFAVSWRRRGRGCASLLWRGSVIVGMETPRVVNALQEGHCLAWRLGRWCMYRLPMFVPSASIRAAALVASILSIERDLSVALPARSRAFVGLESAVNSISSGLASVSSFSSSSCIPLGLATSADGGLFAVGCTLRSKYGIARSVVWEGAFGLCHSILFSSFVIGFGFEHNASVYASSRSSLLVIWLELVSV